MNKRNWFFSTFLVLLTTACITCIEPTSTTTEDGYLIFGVFYGRCSEDCTTLFKIEDKKLYADAIFEQYAAIDTLLLFQTIPLPNEKYQLATQLETTFPMSLLQEEQVIGMPNVVDQGTVLIEYNDGTITKRWYIDPNTSTLPAYLQPYIESVQEITFELSEN